MTKKSRQKFKYLENKEVLRSHKKHFSLFLKSLQLQKLVSNLRLRLKGKGHSIHTTIHELYLRQSIQERAE